MSRKSPLVNLFDRTGSGAWAIQAADIFPKAEVVAVDKISLPTRCFVSFRREGRGAL